MPEQHLLAIFETPLAESEARRAMGLDEAQWQVRCYPGTLHSTEADLRGVECLAVSISSEVTEGQLERLPDVRLITLLCTGYDKVDLPACRARGLTVCNVPGYGRYTVAEHALGLILGLSRRVIAACERTRQGNFSGAGLGGWELYGKTLGVVGAGAIGLHLLRLGAALGMRCLAYTRTPSPELAREQGFSYVDLDTLLAESDVVSLHAPLLPATRHMINADALARMKPGALLINTARGELVDSIALLEALDSGHLGGAGLDVYEGEGLAGQEAHLLRQGASCEQLQATAAVQALRQRADVALTPHIGSYSQEAIDRILQVTGDNLRGFFAGEPQNVVS